MTNLAEHMVQPVRRSRGIRTKRTPGPRPEHCSDRRWPAVVAALNVLRAEKRRSVRIVDTDCANGTLLLCAVRQASALGFTAIEARGVDAASALVADAQAMAAQICDPAIGICFQATDLADALEEEAAFPADILLARSCAWSDPRVADLIGAAARLVIEDADAPIEIAA
jgi:hypothetical protein